MATEPTGGGGAADGRDSLRAAAVRHEIQLWLRVLNWFFLGLVVAFAVTLCAVAAVAPTCRPDEHARAASDRYWSSHQQAQQTRTDLNSAHKERKAATQVEDKRSATTRISQLETDLIKFESQAAQAKVELDAAMAEPATRRWRLALVAIGGLAAGMLVGFLYATFGDETKTFSSFTTAVNSFLAGAAATDLAKKDSVLRAFFNALATCCGMDGCGVLVGVVVVAFGTVGFLFLYVNKRLILNVLTAASDDDIQNIAGARSKVTEHVRLSGVEPGHVPDVSPGVRLAAQAIVSNPDVGKETSLDSLMADAKAFYIESKFEEAEQLLRKAVVLYPDDADALLYLSNALIAQGKELEAIPFLEKLTKMPGARAAAWKLLGYVYLWPDDKARESVRATERYLAIQPNDLGAHLNLAAALARSGPKGPNRERVVNELRPVVADPVWKDRVRELAESGEEFAGWRKAVPKFANLLR